MLKCYLTMNIYFQSGQNWIFGFIYCHVHSEHHISEWIIVIMFHVLPCSRDQSGHCSHPVSYIRHKKHVPRDHYTYKRQYSFEPS